MFRSATTNAKATSCIIAAVMLCLSFVQPAFADDDENQKKKKDGQGQGLPLPDFNFLFGKGKSKNNGSQSGSGSGSGNSRDDELTPSFPMSSKKQEFKNRNNSEFMDLDENSSRKSKEKDNGKVNLYPGSFGDSKNGSGRNSRNSGNQHTEIYSSYEQDEKNQKNKKNRQAQTPVFPYYEEDGQNKKRNNGQSELYPGAYDENGKKKKDSSTAGNVDLYPSVYDDQDKNKKKRDNNGQVNLYPGVYDENGKKKKSDGRSVDIYSSVYDDKDKKKKENNGQVNLSPYIYDEDGKKKKSDNNGNLQILPYDPENDKNKKKDKTANGGKMEILPGTGNDGEDGWNGNSPFGSQGILNSTGLGGIGGFFNPSRFGAGDRWGQYGRGSGGAGSRAYKRVNWTPRRPVITMPGGPGTGNFAEIEKPLVEDPFKTSASPSASGNPGQVSNFSKQTDMNERDISPGQAMWCGEKAQMPAYGDRGGTMASCFHQQTDPGCQPNSIPGARDVGSAENKVSERLGDIGKFLGFNTVGTDNLASAEALMGAGENAGEAAMENRPHQNMQEGQAQAMGQSSQIADAAAELGHDQGAQAMTYVGSYLNNFTTSAGNKWNQIRDNIFVPMGILLLLPGAMITQVRAIMAQSNPVLGQANPFEGILRSLVALFFIPGSYLVMNYGIDISNSLTYTIAEQYQRLFGTDMYRDAMCHEIKAMPFRLPEENRNTIDLQEHSMGQILVAQDRGPFSKLEAQLLAVKIWDPCDGIYIVPIDRCQEVVPVPVIACRMACNLTNASLLTSWNILCAFQCAYLYFLWCMGPVVAGLWTWPMKQFRDAFPNWVEGVLAVCFWALFWNATVLVIALVRRDYETGTMIMIALNTIGNISVKFAFDFAGLIKSAGDEAMQFGDKLAEKAGNAGGK